MSLCFVDFLGVDPQQNGLARDPHFCGSNNVGLGVQAHNNVEISPEQSKRSTHNGEVDHPPTERLHNTHAVENCDSSFATKDPECHNSSKHASHGGGNDADMEDDEPLQKIDYTSRLRKRTRDFGYDGRSKRSFRYHSQEFVGDGEHNGGLTVGREAPSLQHWNGMQNMETDEQKEPYLEEDAEDRGDGHLDDLLVHDETLKDIREARRFTPTLEQFADFNKYVREVVEPVAQYDGICAVTPPKEWTHDIDWKSFESMHLLSKDQLLSNRLFDEDFFVSASVSLMDGEKVTLEKFREDARNFQEHISKFQMLPTSDDEDIEAEKAYWDWFRAKHTQRDTAKYMNDIIGSAFPDPVESEKISDHSTTSEWNLKKLPLLATLAPLGDDIPGVTRPMMYIGMKHSTFCWHYEDNKLYSISYNHYGSSRTWYGVSGRTKKDDKPTGQEKFEEVLGDEIYSKFEQDESPEKAIMTKTCMFTPAYLKRRYIDVVKLVQRPGDFIITFPGAYHAGFSHGFSICEAVNFALDTWIPILEEHAFTMRRMKKPSVIKLEQLVILTCARYLDPDYEKSHGRLSDEMLAALKKLYQEQKFLRTLVEKDLRCAQKTLVELKCTQKPTDPMYGPADCTGCKHACFVSKLWCNCHPDRIHCLYCFSVPKDCPCPHWFLTYKYNVTELQNLLTACGWMFKPTNSKKARNKRRRQTSLSQ